MKVVLLNQTCNRLHDRGNPKNNTCTQFETGLLRRNNVIEGFERVAASAIVSGEADEKPRWPPQTAPLVAGQTAPGRTVGL